MHSTRGTHEIEVVEGWAAATLAAARRPQVMLALWHRLGPSGLSEWLDDLPPASVPDGRVLIRIPQARDALATMFDAAGTPVCVRRQQVIADMAGLVRRFAAVAGTDCVDIRLDRIQDDACWRFHRDSVRLRLLTAYRGPGTQWVPARHSRWAINRQRGYGGLIFQMPRFSVGLFKGSAASNETGVVHRSPPIWGSGTTRLVMCLNLPSMASPPPWTG